jgi:hypothetical protein
MRRPTLEVGLLPSPTQNKLSYANFTIKHIMFYLYLSRVRKISFHVPYAWLYSILCCLDWKGEIKKKSPNTYRIFGIQDPDEVSWISSVGVETCYRLDGFG